MNPDLPLFDAYPALARTLPYQGLATLPTPLLPMPQLMAKTGARSLWIKRDDQSGDLYGGNKVRKLEFLLGDALARGCTEVMTFGVAGSNHVLATGLYARKLGLEPIGCVTNQTNSRYVARNLRAGQKAGIEYLCFANHDAVEEGARRRSLKSLRRTGNEPYTIRMGGSSPLGTIGFVNAAFELASQIEQLDCPVPDRIYLPLGTMGSVAGLALGLRALGLPTRVVGIRVVDAQIGNMAACLQLYDASVALLRDADPGFPLLDSASAGIEVRDAFFGQRYAVFTPEGMTAVRVFAETEQVGLEGTYTGKAAAALLHDLGSERDRDQNLLFWNTYNSRPLGAAANSSYRDLPQPLWRYFETEVQPLDRDA